MATPVIMWNSNKTLLNALESNTRIIQRAMMNNFILLKRADTSVNEQIRQIAKRTDGFKLDKSRMSRLKAGTDKKMDITIISILSAYWNLPIEDMLIKEMWREE